LGWVWVWGWGLDVGCEGKESKLRVQVLVLEFWGSELGLGFRCKVVENRRYGWLGLVG
jgi:hypothetical protein